MANINNWHDRFNAGLESASPFTATGSKWCGYCKIEIIAETRSAFNSDIWRMRTYCPRCKRIIEEAIFDPTIRDGRAGIYK